MTESKSNDIDSSFFAAVSPAQESCLRKLNTLQEQLQHTSSQIETSVLGVCDSFSRIAVRARKETTRLLQLLDRGDQQNRSASFESLLNACNQTLIRLLEAQTHNGVMIAEAIHRLEGMDAAAVNITKALQQLDQIAHSNRLLALNARIEASHSPQHERGFTAVAIELGAQTERSKSVTSDVANLSELLRSLAGSAVSDLQRMQRDDAERNAQVRTEVNGALDGLSQAYQVMREAVDRSQAESSLLADEIGDAIRGMQFQDRVGQQIGHVVHDLSVISRHFAQSSKEQDINDLDEFSDMVMHEERAIRGIQGEESPEGDIELF